MRSLVVAAVLAVAAPARADDWEVRVPDDVTVTAGTASTLSLTIVGAAGRTVSKDGPVRISLASDTLKLPRARYDRRHAADPAADAPRFDLRFTAPASGDHALALDIRFWLCGAHACTPIHTTRTVAVHATAP